MRVTIEFRQSELERMIRVHCRRRGFFQRAVSFLNSSDAKAETLAPIEISDAPPSNYFDR